MDPLAGLERIAASPKPHVSPDEPVIEETLRDIDLDATGAAPKTGSAGSTPGAAAKANRALTFSLNAGETPATQDEGQVVEGVVELLFNTIGDGEFQAVITLGDEPNLENMASTLNLSDSQKARIAALMEWRRGALEALTDAEKADPERVQKIEDFYRASLDLELDQNQSRQYAASRSMVLKFTAARLTAVQALEKDVPAEKPRFTIERLMEPEKK